MAAVPFEIKGQGWEFVFQATDDSFILGRELFPGPEEKNKTISRKYAVDCNHCMPSFFSDPEASLSIPFLSQSLAI
jgi:hypothetical protein